jgi:RimJ/RimL family protein N-acetyltransferase
MTKKRFFYGVQYQNEIVHCGWVNIGFCRYYLVEKNAIVIGPIWTSEKVRGKGLATWALQEAMDTMIRNGFSIFYIDTERDNLPCQKVIEKSGFGLPVAVYLRKCATTILA